MIRYLLLILLGLASCSCRATPLPETSASNYLKQQSAADTPRSGLIRIRPIGVREAPHQYVRGHSLIVDVLVEGPADEASRVARGYGMLAADEPAKVIEIHQPDGSALRLRPVKQLTSGPTLGGWRQVDPLPAPTYVVATANDTAQVVVPVSVNAGKNWPAGQYSVRLSEVGRGLSNHLVEIGTDWRTFELMRIHVLPD